MNETEYKGKLKTLTQWYLNKKIDKYQFEALKEKLNQAYKNDPANRVVRPEDIKRELGGQQ